MTKPDAATTWAHVHAERARLADDLASLSPDAWRTPSLCAGWSVHDVLAHLVDVALTSRLGFVRRMLAARLDFDRDNQTGVDRERRTDPGETLAAWRAVVPLRLTPPAPLVTRLVEAYVHGEDVRRPLAIAGDYPDAPLLEALRHQVATRVGFGGGRERVAGLRLVASDADYVHGAGPEVRGRAVDLLMAVSGRPVRTEAFDGAGAAAFLRPS